MTIGDGVNILVSGIILVRVAIWAIVTIWVIEGFRIAAID